MQALATSDNSLAPDCSRDTEAIYFRVARIRRIVRLRQTNPITGLIMAVRVELVFIACVAEDYSQTLDLTSLYGRVGGATQLGVCSTINGRVGGAT